MEDSAVCVDDVVVRYWVVGHVVRVEFFDVGEGEGLVGGGIGGVEDDAFGHWWRLMIDE